MGRYMVSFATLTAYASVIILSTTHRDLLAEQPVKLPLIDVSVPLPIFFIAVPLIALIFHVLLLLYTRQSIYYVSGFDIEVRSCDDLSKADIYRNSLDISILSQAAERKQRFSCNSRPCLRNFVDYRCCYSGCFLYNGLG
jgi:hypothetical protein